MDGYCQLCDNGFFWKDGYCVACPIHSQYSQEKKECVCEPGYALNSIGLCQNNCPSNSLYNPLTKKCVCSNGMGLANG